MVSLPLATFEFVRSPAADTQIARGFATAAVLMVLVLVLFTHRPHPRRPAGRPPVEAPGPANGAPSRPSDLARIEARDASGRPTSQVDCMHADRRS